MPKFTVMIEAFDLIEVEADTIEQAEDKVKELAEGGTLRSSWTATVVTPVEQEKQ